MTREELRKKRKEIAESNGYKGYVPKSVKEGTRQEVRQTNQQPVQENKSTWQKITDRVNTIANSTPGRFVRKEIQVGNTVRKAMTNPTKAVADIGGNLLNKKIGDNTEYVAKKTGAGLVSGVTGIGSSFVTDTANQLKKGEKQSTYGTVMNAVNTLLAPDTTNIMKGTQQTIKGNIDILKDKDKNAWQKIAGVGQNTVSGAVNSLPLKQKTNAVIQAVGSVLKKGNTIPNEENYGFAEDYGAVQPGNIDINNRKVKHNNDGSISTEKSITIGAEVDGQEKYFVIPTIIDGKQVSDKEAEEHFFKTHEHLGMFDDSDKANEYAEDLHIRQNEFYKENENLSDKVLQLNETINKPSQAINNALAEESQKYGMPTQLVGDAMQSVGNMLPSIATTMVTGDPTARSICYGTRC